MIDHIDKDYPFALKKSLCSAVNETLDINKLFPFSDRNGHWVSYATEYINGQGITKYDVHRADGCFVDLQDNNFYSECIMKNFYSAIRYRPDIELETKEFLIYLFDKNKSPYRKVLDNYEWYMPTRTQPGYFRLAIDNVTSAQMVVSLAMAARYGIDFPGGVRLFSTLIKKGYTEPEALYVTFYFNLNKKGEITTTQGVDYYGFSAKVDNSFERIRDGDPRLNSDKFLYGYESGTLQNMWSEKIFDDSAFYDEDEQPTIFSKLKCVNKYTGTFPTLYKRWGEKLSLSMPTLNEIINSKDKIFEGTQ